MADVQMEEVEGVTVVGVDPDACAAIWRELEPKINEIKGVVLGFDGVTYLNSMNIAAIISLRGKLEAAGKPLQLAALSDGIASIFRVLKLERLFDLRLSRDQAIAAALA